MANSAAERFSRFVFDFDGVLFESARECFTLALRAVQKEPWRRYFGEELIQKLVSDPALEEKFVAVRYHVGPPWQFALLLRMLSDGKVPARTEDFLAVAREEKSQWEGFTESYFGERKVLAESRAAWLKFFTPHKESLALLRVKLKEKCAKILSTRNDESILLLLKELGGVEITPSDLLPRAGAKEKWEILMDYANAEGVSPESVFFIDDYVAHLLPAKERGFATYLSTWGYLAPGDKEIATAKGLPMLELAQLTKFGG